MWSKLSRSWWKSKEANIFCGIEVRMSLFKKKLDRVSSEVNYDVCMRASILFPVHISDTYTITQFFVRPSVLWLTCFKQSSSLFSYPPLSLFLPLSCPIIIRIIWVSLVCRYRCLTANGEIGSAFPHYTARSSVSASGAQTYIQAQRNRKPVVVCLLEPGVNVI